MTDALTGIPNRHAFDRQLYRACEQAGKDRKPLSLLLLDIDHFKRFNDKYGHQVGDAVLRKLASALNSSIKGRDNGGPAGAARSSRSSSPTPAARMPGSSPRPSAWA